MENYENVKLEFDEVSTLWENFNAQAFQEANKELAELDRKLNPKNFKRTFYKISLERDDLDKIIPKNVNEQLVSLIVFDETA
jgi:hypothetical protein